MYMKTLIITGNDVRNDIEEKTISNWVAEYLKREMCRHRDAKILDHPDKSVTSTKIADKAIHTEHIANYAITKDKVVNGAVTTDKIADKSITADKLALDIVADLGKANTFLYSDGEPICLSEYKNTSGGYEVPDIPVNVFFKLENDTDSILTKFQTADDHYTTLSCDIAPGEVRICVLIQKEVSGADPQNGYLFVLDDNSIRKLLNDKAPTNHASGATTYGVGNASNYGHLKLSDSTTSTSSTSSGTESGVPSGRFITSRHSAL